MTDAPGFHGYSPASLTAHNLREVLRHMGLQGVSVQEQIAALRVVLGEMEAMDL